MLKNRWLKVALFSLIGILALGLVQFIFQSLYTPAMPQGTSGTGMAQGTMGPGMGQGMGQGMMGSGMGMGQDMMSSGMGMMGSGMGMGR